MDETKNIYYRYGKQHAYPIFIQLKEQNIADWIGSTLLEVGFLPINQQDFTDAQLNPHWRLLELDWANARLSKRMNSSCVLEETFGPEEVYQRDGHWIYNYRGFGAMIFSSSVHFWQASLLGKKGDDFQVKLRSFLFRYLSFAFQPMGVVGLWGVPVESGVVVMKRSESQGEALFIDLQRQQLISIEGERSIDGQLEIIRLDSALSNQTRSMRSEELFAFLMAHTTALSPTGIPKLIRESILSLVDISRGIIYPEEQYRSRTDLSY